jgi:hypothetical protein
MRSYSLTCLSCIWTCKGLSSQGLPHIEPSGHTRRRASLRDDTLTAQYCNADTTMLLQPQSSPRLAARPATAPATAWRPRTGIAHTARACPAACSGHMARRNHRPWPSRTWGDSLHSCTANILWTSIRRGWAAGKEWRAPRLVVGPRCGLPPSTTVYGTQQSPLYRDAVALPPNRSASDSSAELAGAGVLPWRELGVASDVLPASADGLGAALPDNIVLQAGKLMWQGRSTAAI